jgi:histone deacetylase 6
MLSFRQLEEQKMETGPSPADLMDVDSDVPMASSILSESCRRRASSLPANLNPPDYTVGYIYSSEMMSHFSPHGHPEQPARIQQIWQTLVRDQLTKKMKWLPIRQVRKEEALLVHSEDHWDKVIALQCEYKLFKGYAL